MNGLETITSWFTPTVLFFFLNFVILTIILLNPHKNQPHPPLIRLPSILDRSKSINRFDPEPDHRPVPSLFERVKSFKLSVRPDTIQLEEPVQEEQVNRTEPETTTVRKVNKKKKAAKKVLKRSVSEKAPRVEREEVVYQRGPDTMREKAPVALVDEVDVKADDFINRFRQQLKLQRLNSIMRYNEMLNRGASSK